MDENPKSAEASPKHPPGPDKPETLIEWLWYVRRYEKGIFVREQKADGQWGPIALSELPPDRWAFHVGRWLDEGHLPCRVREEEELDKPKNNP